MQLTIDNLPGHAANATLTAAKSLSGGVSRTPEELASIVSLFASSDGWIKYGCAPNIGGMSGCIKVQTTIFG
jgi:hypothetical protein